MLKIHSLPESEKKSTLYSITVNGTPVIAEFSRVSAMPFNTPWPGHQRDKSQTEESPFISFESDESVVIEVKTTKKIEKAAVRPLSKNIEVQVVTDNTVKFNLVNKGNYVLEINGIHNPLNIFFNPVRDFVGEAKKNTDRKIYYFGPGVHEIGDLEVESHSTVIIDGGALCYGNLSAFSTEDVEIVGYGMLDGSREIRETKDKTRLLIPGFSTSNKEKFDLFMKDTRCLKGLLRFYFSKEVKCEGVILRDSSTFCIVPAACDNVIFDNVKTIGMWRYNSDGIDIFNSSNVTVKNCFLRNFDDVMVIKGIVGWDFKSNENIVVDNCVLWCDWGAACEIGAETNAPEYKNILYKNCDIIYSVGPMMRIHHHNYADIHHIRYENMRCEYRSLPLRAQLENNGNMFDFTPDTVQPDVVKVVITEHFLYGVDNRKGSIHDIEFENIYINSEESNAAMPQIFVKGLNENSFVKGVHFKNLFIDGKRIENKNELNISVGDFAYDVKFE